MHQDVESVARQHPLQLSLHIPLHLHALSASLIASETLTNDEPDLEAQRRNVTLLRGLEWLYEHPIALNSAAQTPLEAKLDLALLILGDVLTKQGNLPPARRCALSIDRLWIYDSAAVWEAAPQLHTTWRCDLYLEPSFPLPFRLIAEVKRIHEDGLAELALAKLPADVDDALGRFLFRYHRARLRTHVAEDRA